jgi:hypothetical protein
LQGGSSPDKSDSAALTYCRVYVNRQSAAAHHLIFQNIETIIQQDTGKSLQWRHLHAKSLSDLTGILQWTGDQHGGQAKGTVSFDFIQCNLNLTFYNTRAWSSPQNSRCQVATAERST